MRFGLALALAITGVAGNAHAAIFTMTFTGTASGYDPGNFFGLGTFLNAADNHQFSLSFTVDTEHPGATTRVFPNREQLSGATPASNPVILSAFTLNGETVSWGSSTGTAYSLGAGYASRGNGPDEIYANSSAYQGINVDEGEGLIYSSENNILEPSSLSGPLDYHVRPGDEATGFFRSYYFDVTNRYVTFDLRPTRVVVAPVAAPVPEPATWLTMIAGFFAAGGAVRRRRGRLAV